MDLYITTEAHFHAISLGSVGQRHIDFLAFLKSRISDFENKVTTDLELNPLELLEFKDTLERELMDRLRNRKIEPSSRPVRWMEMKIFGKKIQLNPRNEGDELIEILISLFDKVSAAHSQKVPLFFYDVSKFKYSIAGNITAMLRKGSIPMNLEQIQKDLFALWDKYDMVNTIPYVNDYPSLDDIHQSLEELLSDGYVLKVTSEDELKYSLTPKGIRVVF